MRRLLILATALTAVLAFFGGQALFAGENSSKATTTTARTTSTVELAASLEQAVANRPHDVDALTQLAGTYLQRARETGDPSYYGLADTATQRALTLRPDDVNALVVAGTLATSKHDFQTALLYGQRAHDIEPTLISAYSVIVDSLVEMGRYDEAIVAAQEMADRKPDFAALSRISYIRELHGDIDGAIAGMEMAIDAGTGVKQDGVWGRVLLGNLYLTKGDIDGAARQYEQAEALLPDDAATRFGLSRLAIARDDYAEAEALLRQAVEQRPMPEYLIALGDVLSAQGRTAEAADQYDTVRAIQRLFTASGVDTDIELALFDADHGVEPERTYQRALAAYDAGRRGVYAADIVAWAAYKAGRIDAASSYMALALRLGTNDARLSYHAGVIAQASGDDAAAHKHFADAVRMEAGQSVLYVSPARAALDAVTASASR